MNDEEAQKLEQYDAKDQQRRRDEAEAAVMKELRRLDRVPLQNFTQVDKDFVRARATYLTAGQRDTYKDILADRPDLQKLTIKELKEVAVTYRVPNWDKLEKKEELIAAIVAVQTNA